MARPGDASRPEDERRQPEPQGVLLNHQVGRDLRDPEEGMAALIDRHRLVYAVRETMADGQHIAGCLRLQGKPVRAVAVDLVRAHEQEDGFRRVRAHCLQDGQRRHRIDREIDLRRSRGPVVRRLSRRVQHHRDPPAELREQRRHLRIVADVELDMPVAGKVGFKLAPDRQGAGVGPEEFAPRVVVDPDHVEPECREAAHRRRAHQTQRSGDDCNRTCIHTVSPSNGRKAQSGYRPWLMCTACPGSSSISSSGWESFQPCPVSSSQAVRTPWQDCLA